MKIIQLNRTSKSEFSITNASCRIGRKLKKKIARKAEKQIREREEKREEPERCVLLSLL